MKHQIAIDGSREIGYDSEGATDDRLLTIEEVCELLKVSKYCAFFLLP